MCGRPVEAAAGAPRSRIGRSCNSSRIQHTPPSPSSGAPRQTDRELLRGPRPPSTGADVEGWRQGRGAGAGREEGTWPEGPTHHRVRRAARPVPRGMAGDEGAEDTYALTLGPSKLRSVQISSPGWKFRVDPRLAFQLKKISAFRQTGAGGLQLKTSKFSVKQGWECFPGPG